MVGFEDQEFLFHLFYIYFITLSCTIPLQNVLVFVDLFETYCVIIKLLLNILFIQLFLCLVGTWFIYNKLNYFVFFLHILVNGLGKESTERTDMAVS